MFIGDPSLRTPPATGSNVLDPADGTIQPVQWTCPRSNYDTPAYPTDSDGLHGVGIQDKSNSGAGAGFPDINCDGYASPMRADIHFPSCYNPAAGLDAYKTNMQFPSTKNGNTGRPNCPEGWIHTPHLFYEVYWNTQPFADLWTPGQGKQPWVLANGDPTGYSLHGDFISGWDVETLQQIIDNCNAGDIGMDSCPDLIGGKSDFSKSCNIPIPEPAGQLTNEVVTGIMDKLPGNNPVVGFGGTVAAAAAISSPTPSSSAAAAAVASSNTPASAAASAATKASSSKTDSGSYASADQGSSSSSAAAVVAAQSSDGITAPAVTFAPAAATTELTIKTTIIDDIVVTITQTVTRTAGGAFYQVPAATSVPSSPEVGTTTQLSVTTTVIDDVVVTITQTVTRTHTAGVSNSAATAVTTFTSLGCYSDSSTRVLSGKEFVNIGDHQVTTTACIEYCDAAGFSLAGTEWGKQCFCGNELVGSSKVPDDTCHMPCEGDSSQICGGDWALTLYEKNGAAASGVKARRNRRHLHRHARFQKI